VAIVSGTVRCLPRSHRNRRRACSGMGLVSRLATVGLRVASSFHTRDLDGNNRVLSGRCNRPLMGAGSNAHDVCTVEGVTTMNKTIWASYAGSLSALGVATCWFLPMTMMLLGLGGSWLAVFGKIAAASFYVLGIATVLLIAAWVLCQRRGSLPHLKGWLLGSNVLTALAWVIVFNETRINDYLITLM